MYRIIGERGTGKTGQLMLLAKEDNGIIVCANPLSLKEKAKNYGITNLTFLSYKDFTKQSLGSNSSYYIDELEEYIKTLIPYELQGYTLSEE